MPGVQSCIVYDNTRLHAWHRTSRATQFRPGSMVEVLLLRRRKAWTIERPALPRSREAGLQAPLPDGRHARPDRPARRSSIVPAPRSRTRTTRRPSREQGEARHAGAPDSSTRDRRAGSPPPTRRASRRLPREHPGAAPGRRRPGPRGAVPPSLFTEGARRHPRGRGSRRPRTSDDREAARHGHDPTRRSTGTGGER